MNYGKKKKMKEGGMSKMKPAKPAELVKKVTSTEKQKMDSAKQMAMGGKVMKDVPVDKKKGLGKLPEEVRNKMGFKKAGGKVKKMKDGGDVKMTKKQRDFAATAFQPRTPKERKASAINKVKRENKSQSNQERKKESSRKLKEIHSKLKPGMPMFKKGGSTGKRKADPKPPLGVPKFEEPRATAKGQRKAGGMINKKKMMGGGMAMKYGHGGKVGKKCPRDGIAMRGKTRA
jgi:hypothetical protein